MTTTVNTMSFSAQLLFLSHIGCFSATFACDISTHSLVIYLSISSASLCGQMRDTDIYKEVTFNDPKPVLSFIFMRQVVAYFEKLEFERLREAGCR
ncbi:uncharacterized protein RSE6_07658 [Rhynchosporium secalis]|uniref:Uncharacterized protein n=1 Tax=Rhynchosporium secalis TaxID=38038 RepID=A0A1E1MDE6_RHYSE|nr:uncharacterized protein RSE6_07658 [Rhynchosporium secalis]